MVKVRHLVVDSGGFLKNAPIQSMGEKIYSVQEVVAEIRDKATRQRLSFLPYEINFKTPSQDSVQKVVDVSKKTGDYPSLSSVDIKVLALVYGLAKIHDPDSLHDVTTSDKGHLQFGGSSCAKDALPGFYMPRHDGSDMKRSDILEDMKKLQVEDNEVLDGECDEGHSSDELNENEADDSTGGWITPSNISKVQLPEETEDMEVACVTTDFAMQNVMKKMGLNVLSVDGMVIKSIRSYVLRCHACFFITKIMTKVFCPKCGNNTLKRVPMETRPDGTVKYFLSKNPKVLSKKGKKTSLPMPKGGKHSQNPILCEDQPVPQNRISKKAKQKTDVWSDDYAIDGNPFAHKDTESKAFKLGIRHGRQSGRRNNPNAVNSKFVKRH